MRKHLIIIIVLIGIATGSSAQLLTPDKIYGRLFHDVQQSHILPDSKTFADALPKRPPAEIVADYRKITSNPAIRFSLKLFIEDNFILPPAAPQLNYSNKENDIVAHIRNLWPVLKRKPDTASAEASSLLPLPYAYIVPGGRFREVYYWDSYFTMLGLQVNKQFSAIQDMIDNFAYLIDLLGFIPNGNRTYYMGRSQPPFFTLMVELLAEEKGREILVRYKSQIEKEYAFWMDGAEKLSPDNSHRHLVCLADGSLLNRYWDDGTTPRPEAFAEDKAVAAKANADAPTAYRHIRAAAESGWDFSSRWFKDGHNMFTVNTADLLPVDLNCLLLHMEETLLDIYKLTKEEHHANQFATKVEARKKAVQQYCWSQKQAAFVDYNFIEQAQVNMVTAATASPLFFGLASAEQATIVAKTLEEKFIQKGGLATTLNRTGQQWDAPNGWAPLQWLAYKGLKNYGHTQPANEIKTRWMALNDKVYAATGKMMEKYNVMDDGISAGGGEYPNQDGFGWTNGVYLKFSAES